MRLSEYQKMSILSVLAPYGQVYLYGSRAKDHLKGGDIDLSLATRERLLTDPFLASIFPDAVPLNRGE